MTDTRWIPMEPQPSSWVESITHCMHWDGDGIDIPENIENTWYSSRDCTYGEEQYLSPFSVGERIPEREEWRVISYSSRKGIQIEYGDGKKIWYKDYKESQFDWLMSLCINEWAGPVDEMPLFAVRKWSMVVSVEAKQPYDIQESVLRKMKFDVLHPECLASNLWGWLIITTKEASEVEDEK